MDPETPVSASNSGIVLCWIVILFTWVFAAIGVTEAFANQQYVASVQALGAATGVTLAALAVRYLAILRNIQAIRYNHEVLGLPLKSRNAPE